jgi:hypothetical protein
MFTLCIAKLLVLLFHLNDMELFSFSVNNSPRVLTSDDWCYIFRGCFGCDWNFMLSTSPSPSSTFFNDTQKEQNQEYISSFLSSSLISLGNFNPTQYSYNDPDDIQLSSRIHLIMLCIRCIGVEQCLNCLIKSHCGCILSDFRIILC